jgi:hypothetical protein
MIRLVAVALAVLFSGWVSAQVDVDLTMARDAFLPAEDIEVGVRISNFTGSPLTLGKEPRWLHFTVERISGGVTERLSEPPESGEFTLEQATRGKLTFNIAPLFRLATPGAYRVSAAVLLPGGEQATSAPKNFEIISGARVSEGREVGWKSPDGTIERRKFIVQKGNFQKKPQLYVRITDASEAHTIKVLPLGNSVSFDRPEWVVDRQTRFHILHRTDASHYLYHIILPDGTIESRQMLINNGSGLTQFRVNDEGEIRVFGAIRRAYPGELPAPKETAASTNAVAPDAKQAADPAVPEATKSKSSTNDVQKVQEPR